jgi:PhzF family phenazine biosynthesis protein
MHGGTLYRLAAFPAASKGGNPAGVWVGDSFPDTKTMQGIAADVGYSETAFVTPGSGTSRDVRYFSPEAEVPFCGHATIATGVVLGRTSGEGTYEIMTAAGVVPVKVCNSNGVWQATLTSVDTRHENVPVDVLKEYLDALSWQQDELDSAISPVKAYAGAWHLVLAARTRARLADLDYDFDRLKTIMLRDIFTTVQLIWRENEGLIHARNPFPVGGVVEDPATGAAAAALGGYLRDSGLITAPAQFTIRQGEYMGSTSLLKISVPVFGGIVVSGSAIEI